MKIALVALPWSVLHRPSAAVAALGSFLRQREPSWEVQCLFEYTRVAPRVGVELYEFIAEAGHSTGEAAFIPCVYPEKRDAAVPFLVEQLKKLIARFPDQRSLPPWLPDPGDPAALERTVLHLTASLKDSIDEAAARVAHFDVVGLTTCFGQLWANLAFAKAAKEKNPNLTIVLGGSTVSSAVGPSVLALYPFVDYIVQGEGELPMHALVTAIAAGARDAADALKGVVSQRTHQRLHAGAEMWEVPDLNALPVPSYDEYVEQVEALGMPLDWYVPLEGSRGCWWDRIGRTGNAKDTCYFCNLNLQWKGYREKTVERVAQEMLQLSERYANTRVFFLDNIIRHKGVLDLVRAIEDVGQDFELFHEMRANVTPLEWVRLRDVGLELVQVGIEGLSTSYLRRIGKGTTAMQNLQAMRYLRELDISHFGNLILDFPGATQAEVDETLQILLDYAVCFDPLNPVNFALGRDSTVFRLQGEFPIKNVRNRQMFADILPDEVNQSLKLFDLSFDFDEAPADWSAVRTFCERFLQERPTQIVRKAYLSYRTGDSFLRIYDRRGQLAPLYESLGYTNALVAQLPWARTLVLRGDEAKAYTFCMKVRTVTELRAAFPKVSEAELDAMLERWHQERIVYREGKRLLALAVAENPRVARERVLAQESEPKAAPAAAPDASVPARRALPVVA
jgi:ribosomal peptide maturation radical SAM protein 1